MGCRGLYLWNCGLGKKPAAGCMQITGYGATELVPCLSSHRAQQCMNEDAHPSPCPCLLHWDAPGMMVCMALGKVLGDTAPCRCCRARAAPGAPAGFTPCNSGWDLPSWTQKCNRGDNGEEQRL